MSSHEPCSLCLSAITFSGFDNFYYLFPYEITNNEFSIPHDLKILKEVFRVNNGEYNKENSYWKSQNINMLVERLSHLKKEKFMNQLEERTKSYVKLSNQYQATTNDKFIHLKSLKNKNLKILNVSKFYTERISNSNILFVI